jgi:hypothetical protein
MSNYFKPPQSHSGFAQIRSSGTAASITIHTKDMTGAPAVLDITSQTVRAVPNFAAMEHGGLAFVPGRAPQKDMVSVSQPAPPEREDVGADGRRIFRYGFCLHWYSNAFGDEKRAEMLSSTRILNSKRSSDALLQ